MKSRLLLLIVLYAAPGISTGQNFVFKVVINKGDTQYKTFDIIKWEDLNPGTELKKNDFIKLGPDSYLGLLHVSGRIAEVVEPGEMRISELESNLRLRKKGLPAKYSEFVFNTVVSSNSETLKTRGLDDIHVYLPPVSQVYDDEFLIIWEKYEGVNEYEIVISDIMDDEIWRTMVTGTSMIINLSTAELAKQRDLIVLVSTNKYQSKEYVVSRLSEQQSEAIRLELDSFVVDLDTESPIGNVILGAFYEENDLILDAFYHYYLASDRNVRHSLIQTFLGRHQMLK